MKKFYLIIIFSFVSRLVYPQIREIDSLKHLLATTKEDTTRVMALKSLSFYTENADTALKMDSEALALARKIGFERGEAYALNQFGNDFWGSSNYPKALDYYLQSLKLNEKLGNLDAVAANNGNISNIYSAQEDYTTALSYLYKAVNLYTKTGSDRVRLTYGSLGNVYRKINKFDSALTYYQKSNDIYNRISDKYQLSTNYYGLGDVNARLGNTELAFAYYRMGLAASEPYKGSLGFPTNYYGLANLFKETGHIDSSIFYARKALEASDDNKEWLVKSATLLADLYEGKDDKQYIYYYKLATITSDGMFTAQKQLQLKNMSYNEQERQNQITAAELKTKKSRQQNLQYAAIAFGLITFAILFFLLTHSIIANQKLIRFLGIVALLIVFEFLNLFIHPYLAHATHDSPLIMLLVMVCIAALLVPMHHRMEKWISHRLVEKNNRIRLAAAKKTIAQLDTEQIN